MPSPDRRVSVVIPSWNGAKFVAMSLEKLVVAENISEVVVVDHGRLNRETEQVMARFSAYPFLRYVGEDQQLGFTGAVNRGVREATHDLIAVICNDVLVEKDWMTELLKALPQSKSPVLFSKVDHGRDQSKSRFNFWFRLVTPEGALNHAQYFFPDGSAFLFQRSVYGLPFDSEYFLYQEDVYLGWRAWLMGEEVRLVPRSRVVNFDGGTTKRIRHTSAFYSERNRWLNYFSFLSGWLLLRAWPVLALDACLKLAGGSNRLAKLQAYWWLTSHIPSIRRKRRLIQAQRRRKDREFLPLLSGKYADASPELNTWFGWFVKILRLPLGE